MTLTYDAVASGVALFVAINIVEGRSYVDLGGTVPLTLAYALAFMAVAAAAVYSQGLHRGIWRYTSFGDCVGIFRATALTLMVFVPLVFVLTRAEQLPRSATIIAGLAMMALLAAPRILTRGFADHRIPKPFMAWSVLKAPKRVPIILVGKATRAETFLRNVQKQHDVPYIVVGVLTDETTWHGRTIHGIGVFGGPKDLEGAVAFLKQRKIDLQRLVVADDKIDMQGMTAYLELANRNGLTLGRLPRLMDIDSANTDAQSTVQPVAIGDLLDRPQVIPNCDGLRRLVENRRVLISGAGGSIGSELVRQLSELTPAEITLVENTEFNLYAIDHELEECHPELKRTPVICDVRDRVTLNKCFEEHRPDIVFHAAALKHVPMVEFNPIEGIRTNALGTQNIADACVKHRVFSMVLISTDKAVNPHNVMGASKRCAEAYCQALDAQGGSTRFVAVRFGNVLGSTGSVVPLFQRQLATGGPITVTHPDIERFFMTIPEAVRLVLQASVLGASGTMPRGCVYVLDMGKPIKIAELARRMIRLVGKEPDKDIKIVYTGLRPGEKLSEEIAHAQEELTDTPVPSVMMVSPRTSELSIIQRQFAAIAEAATALDRPMVLSLLSTIVPEYRIPEDMAQKSVVKSKRFAGRTALSSAERMRSAEVPKMAQPRLTKPATGGDAQRRAARGDEGAAPYSGS
jgi:O-antigen biosynthesis protein WbqV